MYFQNQLCYTYCNILTLNVLNEKEWHVDRYSCLVKSFISSCILSQFLELHKIVLNKTRCVLLQNDMKLTKRKTKRKTKS